jgi:hypothetical protein
MTLTRPDDGFEQHLIELISLAVVLLIYRKLDTRLLKRDIIRAFSWTSSCKTLKNVVLAIDFPVNLR